MNSYFIPLFPKSELHLESNDFFFFMMIWSILLGSYLGH